MISEKKYISLITKSTPLTMEEQKQVQEFEKMLYYGKKYQEEITSPEFTQIANNYEHQIEFLSTLTETEKNQNIQNALKDHQQIQNQITNIETKKQQQEEQAMKLERKLQSGFEKRAGFTNASIIIFFVLLLGIILSIGLLSLA